MSDWFKKGAVTFALAFNKTEKDSLAQNAADDIIANNIGVVTPYVANKLMQDLKEGRLTKEVKEFRKHYYQILKESSKYKEGKLLSEEDIRVSKIAKGDPYDNYPVEIVFDNKSSSDGIQIQGTRPLKVERTAIPRHRIENYIETIHIRQVDGDYKLIDMYIPIKSGNESIIRELDFIKENPKVTDLLNFNKIGFTTMDNEMLVFEYQTMAFDKVVEYNNNFIIKMFAKTLVDGRWLADKFMTID